MNAGTVNAGLAGDAPVIRIRGVRTQFGPVVVHDNLDLDVRRGEILGVIGGSGTGKSVLMRAILKARRSTPARKLSSVSVAPKGTWLLPGLCAMLTRRPRSAVVIYS